MPTSASNHLNERAGQPNQPIAVRTALGWVLSGPESNQALKECSTFKAVTTEDQHLANQVQHWWELESYGSSKTGDSRSWEDQYALKILEATTYHDGSRYVVGKLWPSEASSLPNNYYYALAQLRSLEKRFYRDPALKERYASTIKEDIQKEYVIEVPSAEIFETTSPCQWDLPHHPVQNPLKPDKVRRVLNGAAKFRDVSLNSALLRGPVLLQNLLQILLRFRQHQYAVLADIEGMFPQVGVPEKDQPALRFLWRETPSEVIKVYQYTRHNFGAKDSPTCANYALNRTGVDNCSQIS